MGHPLPPEIVSPTPATQVNAGRPGTELPQNINVYPPAQPPSQYFTAEQLEAARQQEKDKLYDKMKQQQDQLDAFKTDMETYKADREAAQTAAQQAADAAAETQRLADEEKLSVTDLLKKRDDEWKARQAELETKLEVERAIMQKDRELFQLQSYIQRRVSEEIAANTIIPDLVDFVDGNTSEEVEQSITRLKEKTVSIVEGRQRMVSGQPSTPGVSPTGFAPTGPLDNLTGTQQYSPEDIRGMSNAEYAKFRAQVGIDRAGNNKGLFN